MNELPAPPEVAGDAEAVEVLRAWVVRQTLHCALQADAFSEPRDWGVVLADLVQHIARAVRQQENVPAEQTIRRILDVLGEELRTAPPEEGAAAE
jgi:hypothetical protein